MGLIFIIVWIICAFVTSSMASSKGHGPVLWFFMGLIFGIFGVIAAALLPETASNTQSSKAGDQPETRECPFCAEIIKAKASVCRYCGKEVEPTFDYELEQERIEKEESLKTIDGLPPREKLAADAERKGWSVNFSEKSNKIILTKGNESRDFLVLKRALDFIDAQ